MTEEDGDASARRSTGPAPATVPSPGELHVWRVPLGPLLAEPDALLAKLSPREAAVAESGGREGLLLALERGLLRDVLARYGLAPRARAGVAGRAGRVRFCVAASSETALCALSSDGRVGVGLQQVGPVRGLDALAAAFGTAAERAQLADAAAATSARWWAAKKALLLASRERAPHVLPSLPLRVDGPLVVDAPNRHATTLVELRAAPAEIAVVAVGAEVDSVVMRDWHPTRLLPRRPAARRRPARPAFVDTHSHVVPSGDDGVESVREGTALAHEAAARGTAVLYATPHVSATLPLTPTRERSVRDALATMRARVDLDLRLGFELTPADALLGEDVRRYVLEGTDAVLVEADGGVAHELVVRLAEHVEQCGLRPVVAHPERSLALARSPSLADDLVGRGWVLQVSGGALLRRYGPTIEAHAWALLASGRAALVASDGHGRDAPPFLDAVYELLARRLGARRATALVTGSALAEDAFVSAR